MSSDDEGQGGFFQETNNNYDIYSHEEESEQFQTVIIKNLTGPKRVAPGQSSLGNNQNLLKTYLDQANAGGGPTLAGNEADLFYKTRESKSSNSQWSQQQDDKDEKPQRGRGRGRARGGLVKWLPPDSSKDPPSKSTTQRGRGRKAVDVGGVTSGAPTENQLPKKRGRKAKNDLQQPLQQDKKPNDTQRYLINPPIVLKPQISSMQNNNTNRQIQNSKPNNISAPIQTNHDAFENGDQTFDLLRTSSQDEFMAAPLASDPFVLPYTLQKSNIQLATPTTKTAFQTPPAFQQVQKKPQPPQLSHEMQQRQQNIAEIAAKALDEVEQVEKMIEEKLKTQILMRFKKAVKSILQGLVEEFERPPNDKNDDTIDASLQALQFVQCEISKIHSRVNDIVQYKIPSGNDFTPTMNLTAKTLMIRDEVNLPLEDFAGTVLTPHTFPGQSINMVTLNRDLYECSFDHKSNRVKFTQLFQLKTQPRFFFAHQGNLCFDSGIYVAMKKIVLAKDSKNQQISLMSLEVPR